MSKKIGIIVGLLVVILLAGLIACDWTNSAVFELQEGEAEKLGVVLPDKPGDFAKLYHQYEKEGKYEEMIVVAKAMDDYSSLESAYAKAGRYEEALVVNEKLIEMNPEEYRYIGKRVALFEKMGKQEEAIKALQKYRKNCPQCELLAETLIPQLEEAISKGKKVFPSESE